MVCSCVGLVMFCQAGNQATHRLAGVLQELGLGSGGVTQQQHIDVPSPVRPIWKLLHTWQQVYSYELLHVQTVYSMQEQAVSAMH